MAIIGKIRERSTLVLIIIGGAILAFVLSDLFSSSTSGQQGPINLAEVEGTSISAQEFDSKVTKAYENYQANSNSNEPLDERTKSGVREQVWNEMVSDVLLGKEMNSLGVKVTSKELFDMVQGNDPHPNVRQAFTNPETGEFNSAAVVQFIQNLDNDLKTKDQWIAFERALKRNQTIEKYNTLVEKGIYTPSSIAKMLASENNNTVGFSYISKAYASVNDTTIAVTEDELKSYYKEHLSDFEQKASRKAFYAYFPVRPSEADVEMTKKWADEALVRFQNAEYDSAFVNANSDVPFDATFYSERNLPLGADTSLLRMEEGSIKGPYMVEKTFFIQKVRKIKMAPDSVKASHILINMADRTPERAEEIADSLMNLLNNGSTMAELAPTNSDDVGSGKNGGDLGWFTEGTMVKPFNDAAFSAKVGEFTKAKSQFGIHIIEVTEQTGQQKKIQIATIRRTALPGKQTYADIFNKANSFSIEATDLESFNNLVNEDNLQRRLAVLSENDNLIQGEPASRDIVRWIKQANEGDVSEAYDLDDAFVVAVVDQINEEGPAPLDRVKTQVEFEVRKKKKAEMFKNELAGSTNLNELAGKAGLTVAKASNVTFASPAIPNIGIEPVVVGKAFSLQKGQMSVPIEGKSGVFVISIDEMAVLPDPDYATVQQSQGTTIQSRINNGAVFMAIKDKAKIVDNRSKFY